MKFRKKPAEIEAEQFNGEILKGMCASTKCIANHDFAHHIHNAEPGISLAVEVMEGDWVMLRPNGTYYPISDEDFKRDYEAV